MIYPVPLLSLPFAKAYWKTMRPYLLFISGITGLAGLSFTPEISLTETLILFLVFFLSYGFGQALTDCFQTDTDAISSPYRPLIQGQIVTKDVIIVSLLGLLVCGVVLAVFSMWNFVLAAMCIGGLATYSFFKRFWFSGPVYNSWIIVVLFTMGYVSGIGVIDTSPRPSLIYTLICVFAGYANFVLTGYFKDIEADRMSGYETMLVKFGRDVSAKVSDVFAAIFIVAGGMAVYEITGSSFDALHTLMPAAFFVGSAAVTMYTQLRLHRVSKDEEAYKAVVPCVHAYLLLLISVTVSNKLQWGLLLLLFYLLFHLSIRARPERTQI